MFYAIGQDTQTLYAIGDSRADCMRELNGKFPSFVKMNTKKGAAEKVLPEPIQIIRRK